MTRLLLALIVSLFAVPVSAQVSATTAIDWLQLSAPDGRWAITFGPTANPGDSGRPDTAMTWGWNNTADGGRKDSGEPALMFRIENYYHPTGTDSYLESHLQYVSSAGTVFRPFGWQITRGTNFIYGQVLADAFNYLSANGTQYVKWVAGQQMLMNSMIIASYTNNAKPFRQAKVSGSLASLIYINASDKIVVGDSGAGHVVIDATALELGGETGVTVSGSGCIITAITGGLVTGAACVP
jgi:hypothetical protein